VYFTSKQKSVGEDSEDLFLRVAIRLLIIFDISAGIKKSSAQGFNKNAT
jgi:hypothetical protein